jgi:transposase-like protein
MVVQRRLIHQIRNSAEYVSYKDLAEFTRDLKPIYGAASEDSGLAVTNTHKMGLNLHPDSRTWIHS